MRVITRLDETCREVRDAARVIGDASLMRKMEEAQMKIKRDSECPSRPFALSFPSAFFFSTSYSSILSIFFFVPLFVLHSAFFFPHPRPLARLLPSARHPCRLAPDVTGH